MAQAGSPHGNWSKQQARPLVMWATTAPRARPRAHAKELYGIVANSPWGIAGRRVGSEGHATSCMCVPAAIDDGVVKALDRVGMAPYYMGGDDYLQWRGARRTRKSARWSG